jgi:pyridoxine 5-phosphate synthase
MPLRLGVNIDHAATLRQARYARDPQSILVEPDPVEAALIAEQAGADGITAHLREDRRHIQDRDIFRLKESLRTKLNLEMGNAPEIVAIAVKVKPHDACLVPENRNEVTTEGGLDCVTHRTALTETIAKLHDTGTVISLFIDPDPDQIQAAADLKAEYIELHTGAFASASGDTRTHELHRLIEGAKLAHELGLRINAGHGLNYQNVRELFAVPHLEELNIGHAIISRALITGLATAVKEMKALCEEYPL